MLGHDIDMKTIDRLREQVKRLQAEVRAGRRCMSVRLATENRMPYVDFQETTIDAATDLDGTRKEVNAHRDLD